MISQIVTLGKGRWQRSQWIHDGQTGIEKTIIDLLESIQDLEHGYNASTCDGLDDGWDYYLNIQEKKSILYSILA